MVEGLLTPGATARARPAWGGALHTGLAEKLLGDSDRVGGAAAGEVVHHAPQPVGAGAVPAVRPKVAEEDVIRRSGVHGAERFLVGPADGGAVDVGLAEGGRSRVRVEVEVDAGGEGVEAAGLEELRADGDGIAEHRLDLGAGV